MKILYCSEIRGNIENLKRVLDYSKADAAVLSGNFIDIFHEKEKQNFAKLSMNMIGIRAQNNIKDSLEVMCENIISGEHDKGLKDLVGAYLGLSRVYKKEAIKQYNAIDDVVKELELPIFMIPGCGDTNNIFDFFGERTLHKRIRDIGDLAIGGYGGSPDLIAGEVLPEGNIEFNKEELYNFLTKNDPDIAVVYHPPYGYYDFDGRGHRGSFALLAYINGEKPNIVLIGRSNTPAVEKKENTVLITPGSLKNRAFMEFELDKNCYFQRADLYNIDKEIKHIKGFTFLS